MEYDELYHYGTKGMKWGVRRYRNVDGTLTDSGKKRVLKSVQKYQKSKDRRAALGKAVGEDSLITEAARKVYPLSKKYKDATARRSTMESKMEREHFNERDRLDKKYGLSNSEQNRDRAWKTVRKKYGKEYDALCKTEQKARADYKKSIEDVVDSYLGKYATKRIKDVDRTAGEAFATQIDWGINLDRLN